MYTLLILVLGVVTAEKCFIFDSRCDKSKPELRDCPAEFLKLDAGVSGKSLIETGRTRERKNCSSWLINNGVNSFNYEKQGIRLSTTNVQHFHERWAARAKVATSVAQGNTMGSVEAKGATILAMVNKHDILRCGNLKQKVKIEKTWCITMETVECDDVLEVVDRGMNIDYWAFYGNTANNEIKVIQSCGLLRKYTNKHKDTNCIDVKRRLFRTRKTVEWSAEEQGAVWDTSDVRLYKWCTTYPSGGIDSYHGAPAARAAFIKALEYFIARRMSHPVNVYVERIDGCIKIIGVNSTLHCGGTHKVNNVSYTINSGVETRGGVWDIVIPIGCGLLSISILMTFGYFVMRAKDNRKTRALVHVWIASALANGANGVMLNPGEGFDIDGGRFELMENTYLAELTVRYGGYGVESTEYDSFWQVAHFGSEHRKADCVLWPRESPAKALYGYQAKVTNGVLDLCKTAFVDEWVRFKGGAANQCDNEKPTFCSESELSGGDKSHSVKREKGYLEELVFIRTNCFGHRCLVPKGAAKQASCDLKELCERDDNVDSEASYNLVLNFTSKISVRYVVFTVNFTHHTLTYKYKGKIHRGFNDSLVKIKTSPPSQVYFVCGQLEGKPGAETLCYLTDSEPRECVEYTVKEMVSGNVRTLHPSTCNAIDVTTTTGYDNFGIRDVRYLAVTSDSQFYAYKGRIDINEAKRINVESMVNVEAGVSEVGAPSTCLNLTVTADCTSICEYTIGSETGGIINVIGHTASLTCGKKGCHYRMTSARHYHWLNIECDAPRYVHVTHLKRTWTDSNYKDASNIGIIDAEVPGDKSENHLSDAFSGALGSVGGFFSSFSNPMFSIVAFVPFLIIGVVIIVVCKLARSSVRETPVTSNSVGDYHWVVINFKDKQLCVGFKTFKDGDGMMGSVIFEEQDFFEMCVRGTDKLTPKSLAPLLCLYVDTISSYHAKAVGLQGKNIIIADDWETNIERNLRERLSGFIGNAEKVISIKLANFSVE